MQSDNIFIIGTGAIGKALAVFLKAAGRHVTLVRGSVDGVIPTTQRLRVVLEDGTSMEEEVRIVCLSSYHTLEGLVLLACKSYGNERLAEALQAKVSGSPLVLLQNGIGVERPFLQRGFEQLYRCVLFVTSTVLDENTVRFKPVAPCLVGLIRGNSQHLNSLIEMLHTPGFPFKGERDIQPVIWKKAIINSVFNSVCPLLDIDNGVFHRSETALGIARAIIRECVSVAREVGIALDFYEVEAGLLQISKASEGQMISTLQDIRHKRRTELETLNLEIVRMAKSQNREGAVCRTKVLGELTKLKADLRQAEES